MDFPVELLIAFALVSFASFVMCEEKDGELAKYMEMMGRKFREELGEDLSKKLEMIATQEMLMHKSSSEVEEMLEAQLSEDEKLRIKMSFESLLQQQPDIKIKADLRPKDNQTTQIGGKNKTKTKEKTPNNRQESNAKKKKRKTEL